MSELDVVDIERRLRPLLEVLSGKALRLVARPSWVSIDRYDGPKRVDVVWTPVQHDDLIADMPERPVQLPGGSTVRVLQETLIMRAPPDVTRRVEDLVGLGWASPLAGRMLTHAIGLGRNALVLGPWAACVELIAAILVDGQRPAVIGWAGDASPKAWPLLADPAEAASYGADRIGVWSLDLAGVGSVMSQRSGVAAYADGGRLERALVRYESIAKTHRGDSGPMHVLGGLDLVVCVTSYGGPRIKQIAEIVLVDDGYRPAVLFDSGRPPAPRALVPVGVPSFVDELAEAGQAVLADELRHAVAQTVPLQPAAQPAHGQLELVAPPAAVHTPTPEPDTRLDNAPPPGWELDQLIDENVGEGGASAATDPDAAVMAASFGLGPPPRPSGVALTPEQTPGPYAGTFADALDRARERDRELRQELQRAEVDDADT